MTLIIVTVAGIWIALSAFILVVICMNSSRVSQMEGQRRRPVARARVPRKKAVPTAQSSTALTSGD